MKRMKKSRIPGWIVKNLPAGKEDEAFSAAIVPTFIFSMSGIGAAWYFFFKPELLTFWILGTILVVSLLFFGGYWLLAQVSLLQKSREELLLSYDNVKDDFEKELLKKKLESLYVYM